MIRPRHKMTPTLAHTQTRAHTQSCKPVNISPKVRIRVHSQFNPSKWVIKLTACGIFNFFTDFFLSIQSVYLLPSLECIAVAGLFRNRRTNTWDIFCCYTLYCLGCVCPLRRTIHLFILTSPTAYLWQHVISHSHLMVVRICVLCRGKMMCVHMCVFVCMCVFAHACGAHLFIRVSFTHRFRISVYKHHFGCKSLQAQS